MSVIITTHDASGHAIFSSKVPEEQHSFDIPIGKMTLLYSTRDLPANLSTEKDIDDFAFNRTNGFGPGVPAPPGGMSAYIMQMAPGLGMPMRRLPAMGVFYVLEGQMTLHLDSGEAKTFRTGDAGVVRGVNHQWTNDTPNGGWAKILGFSMSIPPLEIDGKVLGTN